MSENLVVPTMAEMLAQGKQPEVLFWVGCSGSFDDRAKKITKAFVKILNKSNVSFAVLGTEESCSGDPAKRAGNEFLFQMQAMMNIEVLNAYEAKKIVTACPHCFNTLKNEYPELGGKYEVVHHTEFLKSLLDDGRLTIEGGQFNGKKITFHDPCYLGRANSIYEAPRDLINKLDAELVEMKRSKANGLCCGAGGAQMFKEAENGNKEVNLERADDMLETQAGVVAAACPFCMTMLRDGIKHHNKEQEVQVQKNLELAKQVSNIPLPELMGQDTATPKSNLTKYILCYKGGWRVLHTCKLCINNNTVNLSLFCITIATTTTLFAYLLILDLYKLPNF
jgi:Fe-S oxidoreductase